MREERGKVCRRETMAGSIAEGRWADLLRSVRSAPEASCIQLSRFYRCGAVKPERCTSYLPRPFLTATYYI